MNRPNRGLRCKRGHARFFTNGPTSISGPGGCKLLGRFPGGRCLGPSQQMIKRVSVAGPRRCTSPALEGWTSSKDGQARFSRFSHGTPSHAGSLQVGSTVDLAHRMRLPASSTFCAFLVLSALPSRDHHSCELRFLFSLAAKRRPWSIAATPQYSNRIFDPLLEASTTRHHQLTTRGNWHLGYIT